MKSVKLKENLYKEAERVSKTYVVKVQDIIPRALKQGTAAETAGCYIYKD